MVPPDDAASAARGAPALTVAAVAARLGVAPATLRTWDRRYGLGPSSRLAGSHRRYGAIDVARLMVMRRLTLDGVAPGEAARIARDTPASELDDVHSAMSNVVPIAVESPSGEHLGPVTVPALVDAALALRRRRTRTDRPWRCRCWPQADSGRAEVWSDDGGTAAGARLPV